MEHIYHFKEAFDGSELTVESYDEAITSCGKEASLIGESLAGIKGQLSARAARAKSMAKA